MSPLPELRVLVVEDEAILLLELQELLAELGLKVVGSAARLEPARQLARELAFDVAVLDINLGGVRIDPVAEMVRERGLPIVYLTGYGQGNGRLHEHATVVDKPCQAEELRRAILQVTGISND